MGGFQSTEKKSPSKTKSPKSAKTDEAKEKSEEVTEENKPPNKTTKDESKPIKKGSLWAMPIVPKLPQKPAEKRKTTAVLNVKGCNIAS